MVPRALVRRPGNALPAGIVTHIERRPVDVARAREQWDGYVAASPRPAGRPSRSPGRTTARTPSSSRTRSSCTAALAVLDPARARRRAGPSSPGAEEARARSALSVARIEAPGTLDGGDVLVVGDAVYVGTGGRTNAEGARAARRLLGRSARLRRGAGRGGPAPEVGGHRASRRHGRRLSAARSRLRRSSPRSCAVPEPSGAHVVALGAAVGARRGRLPAQRGALRVARLRAGRRRHRRVPEARGLRDLPLGARSSP